MKSIYFISIVIIFFSCEKTSKNPVITPSSDEVNFTSIGQPVGKMGKGVIDIDANAYKTVIIGTQEWMAENLNVSKYNDGTQIPNESDTTKWFKLESNAWMNNRPKEYNNMKYGKLYNGYVVDSKLNGNKNVCPTGWHVPSQKDWFILSDYLGGANVAIKMKEVGVKHWESPNQNATNVSLFTALPAGALYPLKDSTFAMGNYTGWWTSTYFYNMDAFCISMSTHNGVLSYQTNSYSSGLSIRCVKD